MEMVVRAETPDQGYQREPTMNADYLLRQFFRALAWQAARAFSPRVALVIVVVTFLALLIMGAR